MVYQIIWAPRALQDLQDIVSYIRRDKPEVARQFGEKLIAKAESLASMPERGRIIPKFSNPALRELLLAPYRIAYRIQESSGTVEIARIWHGARDPEDFAL